MATAPRDPANKAAETMVWASVRTKRVFIGSLRAVARELDREALLLELKLPVEKKRKR